MTPTRWRPWLHGMARREEQIELNPGGAPAPKCICTMPSGRSACIAGQQSSRAPAGPRVRIRVAPPASPSAQRIPEQRTKSRGFRGGLWVGLGPENGTGWPRVPSSALFLCRALMQSHFGRAQATVGRRLAAYLAVVQLKLREVCDARSSPAADRVPSDALR